VSRSTAESEYIVAGELAKDVQYVHQLAGDFGLMPGRVPVECDNRAALSLISDSMSAARTKHIDVVYHHIRERFKTQQMQFLGLPTRQNCADVFTKPLPHTLFEEHRSTFGVHP
jgi:hypothetical protein